MSPEFFAIFILTVFLISQTVWHQNPSASKKITDCIRHLHFVLDVGETEQYLLPFVSLFSTIASWTKWMMKLILAWICSRPKMARKSGGQQNYKLDLALTFRSRYWWNRAVPFIICFIVNTIESWTNRMMKLILAWLCSRPKMAKRDTSDEEEEFQRALALSLQQGGPGGQPSSHHG